MSKPMFFQSFWQSIIFGIVTTIGMLAIGYAFALSWKKYEGADKKQKPSCDAHH